MSPPKPRTSDEVGDGESESRNRLILLGVVAAYGTVGVVLLFVAAHVHGPLRYVLGAVGILGVGMAALSLGSLVLLGLGWGVLTGTVRRQPSLIQRAVWLIAAVAFGAFLGTSSYAAGPAGLLSGPLLLAIVVAVVKTHRFDRPYVNRRIIEFAVVAAVVSIPVGLTIFL